MSYKIHWSKKADKVLERLPKEISHRIVHKVNLIKDSPFHFVEHYEGASYCQKPPVIDGWHDGMKTI